MADPTEVQVVRHEAPNAHSRLFGKEVVMFEVGKTYGYMDDGYFRTLRVDYIQHVNGKPSVAIGVTNLGEPDEVFDYEDFEDFEECGWREL